MWPDWGYGFSGEVYRGAETFHTLQALQPFIMVNYWTILETQLTSEYTTCLLLTSLGQASSQMTLELTWKSP